MKFLVMGIGFSKSLPVVVYAPEMRRKKGLEKRWSAGFSGTRHCGGQVEHINRKTWTRLGNEIQTGELDLGIIYNR
jgi:hypothetical protein